MSQLVVLNLGRGDWQQGFSSVIAQIWQAERLIPMQSTGSLPPVPELPLLYQQWRLFYDALYSRLGCRGLASEFEIEQASISNVSAAKFDSLCQQLQNCINAWLKSDSFRQIDQQLRTELHPTDEIRVVIEAEDAQRKLPWHLWSLFEDFPRAEVALSTQNYKPTSAVPHRPSAAVRILAILGNSEGIAVDQDRVLLERLPDTNTVFLVEPSRQELDRQLWDADGWDILFFAGHSASQIDGASGQMQINPSEALGIDQLRNALRAAIARGLKIAIFNSCDGLGLARSLADLQIPQLIVMREPVPDCVAQAFLKHFLQAFSAGMSFYLAERQAREQLQGLEGEFPCASWLPVICQNPTEIPPGWQSLRGQTGIASQPIANPLSIGIKQPRPSPKRLWRELQTVLVVSLITTSATVGLRAMGLFQTWELQTFDHLTRLRPTEPPDDRFLVITVGETDIQYQDEAGMERRGSLSDVALAQLLQKLEPHQPRVLGLDIYHDFDLAPVATQVIHNPAFFAICQVGQSATRPASIAPPPGVAETNVGFSDFPLDPDEAIRRQMFGMTPTAVCSIDKSFSFKIALAYLTQIGIPPIERTSTGSVKLGETIFRKLEYNAGGYQLSPAETNGYQILLNYRSAPPRQEPLRAVLDGSLDTQLPDLVQGRIVLIGTGQDSGDLHMTPYSKGFHSGSVPGVVIHAQMASQILSAVLDRRPLLWWLPQWAETLWIGSWSLASSLLIWQLQPRRSPFLSVLAICLSLGLLHGVCFFLLLKGGWIPLVPAAIALLLSSGGIITYITLLKRRSPLQ